MNAYLTSLKRVVRGEEGASMVEYGLLVALIALAAIAGITAVGVAINGMFTNVAGQLPQGTGS